MVDMRDSGTCLIPNEKGITIRRPCQRESITQAPDFIDTILGSNIPEFNNAITAYTTELCIFNRVEGHFFDRCRMAFEISRKPTVGFLGVPYIDIES